MKKAIALMLFALSMAFSQQQQGDAWPIGNRVTTEVIGSDSSGSLTVDTLIGETTDTIKARIMFPSSFMFIRYVAYKNVYIVRYIDIWKRRRPMVKHFVLLDEDFNKTTLPRGYSAWVGDGNE